MGLKMFKKKYYFIVVRVCGCVLRRHTCGIFVIFTYIIPGGVRFKKKKCKKNIKIRVIPTWLNTFL